MKIPELLLNLRGFLDGKKTYLVGAGMVFTGLANQDWNVVLQGLGLIFVRNSIAKA